MLIAGLGAMFENDLKKVIALSTLRQLGLIIAIIGIGEIKIAFFHLVTHALFKSLLFLCAGYIIHQLGGPQDLRTLGVIGLFCPVVRVWIGVSNFALCGIPFLAGFYSKDLLIEKSLERSANLVGTGLLIIACGLTVAYTVRLWTYVGVSEPKSSVITSYGEGVKGVIVPLTGLGVGGVVGGRGLR